MPADQGCGLDDYERKFPGKEARPKDQREPSRRGRIWRTTYRTLKIDGLNIFYREAGPKDAETLLLLHGLPSSSRMFEPLFTRLSDRYHLIAPDYPGFGHSAWPDPKKFAYTFDHFAQILDQFTEALGLSRYTLYMQDYGGPVGFRMILAHPERVEALIVQDAVAHNEGLGANWKTRRAFWADRTANESALRTNLLSLETTRVAEAAFRASRPATSDTTPHWFGSRRKDHSGSRPVLRFGREIVPGLNVVKVLLYDNVASAGECGIFVADEYGFGSCAAGRIFRAVHKAEEVTFIEVAKPLHFIGCGDRTLEASHSSTAFGARCAPNFAQDDGILRWADDGVADPLGIRGAGEIAKCRSFDCVWSALRSKLRSG